MLGCHGISLASAEHSPARGLTREREQGPLVCWGLGLTFGLFSCSGSPGTFYPPPWDPLSAFLPGDYLGLRTKARRGYRQHPWGHPGLCSGSSDSVGQDKQPPEPGTAGRRWQTRWGWGLGLAERGGSGEAGVPLRGLWAKWGFDTFCRQEEGGRVGSRSVCSPSVHPAASLQPPVLRGSHPAPTTNASIPRAPQKEGTTSGWDPQ